MKKKLVCLLLTLVMLLSLFPADLIAFAMESETPTLLDPNEEDVNEYSEDGTLDELLYNGSESNSCDADLSFDDSIRAFEEDTFEFSEYPTIDAFAFEESALALFNVNEQTIVTNAAGGLIGYMSLRDALLNTTMNRVITLRGDFDLGAWSPVNFTGTTSNDIARRQFTLDGNGHILTLSIRASDYAGLIGCVESDGRITIRNLGVHAPNDIIAERVSGGPAWIFAGGLVADFRGSTLTIERSSVTGGRVRASKPENHNSNGGVHAGGLVGESRGTVNIIDSYTNLERVTGWVQQAYILRTVSVSAGGLVGSRNSGTLNITRCIAAVTSVWAEGNGNAFTWNFYSGGLIGRSSANVTNSARIANGQGGSGLSHNTAGRLLIESDLRNLSSLNLPAGTPSGAPAFNGTNWGWGTTWQFRGTVTTGRNPNTGNNGFPVLTVFYRPSDISVPATLSMYGNTTSEITAFVTPARAGLQVRDNASQSWRNPITWTRTGTSVSAVAPVGLTMTANVTASNTNGYATVTAAAGGRSASTIVEVFNPDNIITVTPAAPNFGSHVFGYNSRPAQAITIRNNGTRDVYLHWPPTATNWTITADADWGNALPPNGTRTLNIRPNNNLAVGTYSPTINVTGEVRWEPWWVSHTLSTQIMPTLTVTPLPLPVPAVPTMNTVNHNSITLNDHTTPAGGAVQWRITRIDGVIQTEEQQPWQTSRVFRNLTPETGYRFASRILAIDNNHTTSAQSDSSFEFYTLIVSTPSVSVNGQVGTMIERNSSIANFPVTTSGIPNGNYPASIMSQPTGVAVQGQLVIFNNSGTLSLIGSTSTIAGTYTLTLTVNSVQSSPFTLRIITVSDLLRRIIDDTDLSNQDSVGVAVDTIKGLDTDAVAVAKADPVPVNGVLVIELMEQLETAHNYHNNITVPSPEIDSALENLLGFPGSEIDIVGAGKNATSGPVALGLSMPQRTITVSSAYSKAIRLNMTLTGEGVNAADLCIPVTITMPIPNGIASDNFRILHFHTCGSTYDLINPQIIVIDGVTYTRFALTKFSEFAFVELMSATPPSAPRDLTVTQGDRCITVNWTAPANNGGAAILYYEVSVNGGDWERLSSNSGHTFPGLTNGLTYTFSVRAVNSADAGTSASMSVKLLDAIEQFVSRLYLEVLGRPADPVGLKDWSDMIKEGELTGADAAYAFFFSPEFLNRIINGSPVTDEQYVNILYRTLLNRTADAAGRDGWVAALDLGWSREDIFSDFVHSIEFDILCRNAGIERGTYTPPQERLTRSFVTRLYRTILGRYPDPVGLQDWTNALLRGEVTGAEAAHLFVFSYEFELRNVGHEEFVSILYISMLGRGADPAGRAGWASVLHSGVSRYDLFVEFVNSHEFDLICTSYGIIRGTAP